MDILLWSTRTSSFSFSLLQNSSDQSIRGESLEVNFVCDCYVVFPGNLTGEMLFLVYPAIQGRRGSDFSSLWNGEICITESPWSSHAGSGLELGAFDLRLWLLVTNLPYSNSSISPQQIVGRYNDNTSPVILPPNLNHELSQFIEGSQGAAQGGVDALVIEINIRSHPGDDRYIIERSQFCYRATCCGGQKCCCHHQKGSTTFQC